jgi:hypothetical protein
VSLVTVLRKLVPLNAFVGRVVVFKPPVKSNLAIARFVPVSREVPSAPGYPEMERKRPELDLVNALPSAVELLTITTPVLASVGKNPILVAVCPEPTFLSSRS